MKIRYILGRAGTGKSQLIFNDIKYRLEQGGENKLLLLVPEQFTLQTEFDLITKNELSGIMRAEVISFERLAYKVFDETGGLKRIDINELGKIMVLKRVFDKHSKELQVYSKASKKEGFLEKFCSLITEFKRNDIYPEAINEVLESYEEESMLTRKLRDINFIYGIFNQYMDGRYSDEEDKLSMLIDKIDESKFLDKAEVWIDGFSGFTSQEYRILEKLILKAEKINIALTLDIDAGVKDKALFAPTKETFDRLREISIRHNAIETKIVLKKEINKSAELKHLEKQIYAFPYNRYKNTVRNIEVFYGTNQYTEIEHTACKIIELVREQGYRWKDIALVNGDMDTYGLIIKRIFDEYEIPFFIDEKRSIMNNPIIKLILSSIDILSRNYRYDDVFRFIKTGFCDLNKDEAEKLENFVLKYGIEGNRWFEDFDYKDVEKEDMDKINEIRKKFITPFTHIKSKLKGSNLVSVFSEYLFEFLIILGIEEKLDSWIEALRERGKLEYVNEYTQIWNIIMEVLNQLVEILGDTKVNLKEYKRILEAGFSQYKVGIIPPTIDQVLVGNLDRSRSHNIKALFVVGVNDGILPSNQDDDGLLLDEEKLMIKEKGIALLSDSETKLKEEEFSIYTSLTKPSKYLWMSYALADSEGKALRPSILIDKIKKIYPTLEFKSDVIKGNTVLNEERELNLVSIPVPTFKYLIENIRLKIDENPVSDLWDEVYNWYYENKDWDKRRAMMIEGLFHNNQEDYIGENRAKNLYNVPLKSSISRLEKFANCPFAHFINYGLKPEERREYKINIPDIGRLFHDSMENFAKKLSFENLNWKEIDKNKCDEIVEAIIDDIAPNFSYNILESSFRYKYLVNKLKRVSKRAAWTLTKHVKKGDFTPFLYELEFGEEAFSMIPPIIIELPGGEEIKLEGRIDRVDILKDEEGSYIKVIDYKSGNKKFSLSDVYYGLQIQLVVYLDAILENKDKLRIDDAHPGGVFYFKLDDPMIESNDDDPASIEKEIMKKLKLDGIITKDIKIVKAMDKDIEKEKNSLVIPANLKKDGSFSKNSSVVEEKEFYSIIRHVRNLIVEIAGEILKGNINIQPCKIDNNISCSYCQYGSICQFDRNFENNDYRVIRKLKDEEVLKRLHAENRGDKNAKLDK
ncbi:helicase-exonuclease AddAB subunit AddB [Paramaledivibacter caminithermalis]|jgi:ATP-dependent helicase/nuclease subunit B|uniref:ATP-dependent helicase/deoxyribonuclease subunit B n=1 Tax=Paramaledivibacter caminithermalis (strain DSM 15212 / CIP 107654 / DViRD3) TaxID=1121301 RepID=A0A1M6PRQ9_PARC5|nr:helicase-exonuclease AddAB subunit AddB [Paramaledivibacter caminithermalis]SHK10633.1 DNA helicase/exodeoxyribonuclease V, subunit B [Paramaledivibacter caminithermalis DSM 15212]